MVENSNALFHVLLMPSRWLQDDVWNRVDIIFNEPFIGTSTKNSKQHQDYNNSDSATDFIPTHYDNVQEVQISRRHIQKKVDYGRIMGHFKKALDYSLEDNDQQNLDDIILAYISEKQAKQEQSSETSERSVVIDENNENNVIKLSDGRVYDINDVNDPLIHNCKGRPTTRRIKGYNEITSNNKKPSPKENEVTNGRKCGICHKIGHYAPRCPNRE
jgi:hypothetical protein